jgi:hypothetical protein
MPRLDRACAKGLERLLRRLERDGDALQYL